MQYVTYEAMFAFAELFFSGLCAFASIITLILTIIKLNGKGKNKRKK